MADEGQALVEDVSLRDNIDLYSELQSEIIWLQGEIVKLTDGNPCKLALMSILESLKKMVKDFKEVGHEEDVWERIQLAKRASVEGTVKQVELKRLITKQQCWDLFAQEPKARSKMKWRIPRPIPQPPVAQFPILAHLEAVGRVSHHLTRVSKTIRDDIQQTLHSVRGVVSSQTGSTGPSDTGGDRADSRPSHDVTAKECGYHTSYVDSTYEMEHGQASFLDAIVDDACREFVTSTSMPTDVQGFLESSVATAYERVGGAGPSREFEEPRVMACPDTAPMASVLESVLGS
eukprot:Gb_16808 [translate_table: standard]